MLGALDMDLGNANGAVREYQAVLALKPVDPAGAHFDWRGPTNRPNVYDEARGEVISSLEAAPGFKPAQKLLLELSAKRIKNIANVHTPHKSH